MALGSGALSIPPSALAPPPSPPGHSQSPPLSVSPPPSPPGHSQSPPLRPPLPTQATPPATPSCRARARTRRRRARRRQNGGGGGGGGGGRGRGARPEPRRRVARPGRGRGVEPGERVHVRAAEEGHRARQAPRYLLLNRRGVVGRHHRDGRRPDRELPGVHGGAHGPGDAPGGPRRAVRVHSGLVPPEGEAQHPGQAGVPAQLRGLRGARHPLPQVRGRDHPGRAGGEADQPRVRGLPVCGAAHAAAAHLLGGAGPRAHQHHGVHQHLLAAGQLHRALHQGHRPGGPGPAAQQPQQPAGAGAVPGAAGRAGLQHPRAVPLHQQGARVLRLVRVRRHLLRGLHHAGPAGLRHPLPRVEPRWAGGLAGHGLRLHHRVRGRRAHPGVQGVQLQPGRRQQAQPEGRLGAGPGAGGFGAGRRPGPSPSRAHVALRRDCVPEGPAVPFPSTSEKEGRALQSARPRPVDVSFA